MRTHPAFLAGALLCSTAAHATVWRVNNNPALIQGSSSPQNPAYCANCFDNLQTAAGNPSVGPGDTLHLEASPVSYGNLILTKRLVIIGSGYLLGQGTANNAGLQASSQMATVARITLNPGADGTVITGVRFSGAYGGLYIGDVSNITATRNYHDGDGLVFDQTPGVPETGFTILRNYFKNSGIGTGTYDQVVSNVIISNNCFIGGGVGLDGTFSNVAVANNLFNWNGQSYPYGAEVKNNLFVLGSVAVNNNSIHHNAAASANGLPPGSGNLNNVVFTSVFNPAYVSDDQKWRLSANYLTYMNLVGDDGTEPGMFGGATPYLPSGIPAIPAIYQLAAPATAVQGAPINVTIGTRSND